MAYFDKNTVEEIGGGISPLESSGFHEDLDTVSEAFGYADHKSMSRVVQRIVRRLWHDKSLRAKVLEESSPSIILSSLSVNLIVPVTAKPIIVYKKRRCKRVEEMV